MIVESTLYFARDGKADDVLRQRRQATAIRTALGLPPGRIQIRLEGTGPDVRWHCEYADRDAYAGDRETRAKSPEFQAAVAAMHILVDRFERHIEESVRDQPAE